MSNPNVGESAPKAGQYLTFRLKSQIYGVPIGTVREINRVTDITPVPNTPKYVAGVMNLRGKVVPVVDLRLKLGMEPFTMTKHSCIIVIDGEIERVGMIVDAVSGVIDLVDSQVEKRPRIGNESSDGFVMGLGKLENQVVVLLDILRTLASAETVMNLDTESLAA